MVAPKTTAPNVISWVPHLFYDVIARLVPGVMIIVSLALAAVGPKESWSTLQAWLDKPSESYPSITIFVGVGLVLSYSLAFVLRGLWSLFALFSDKGVNFSVEYDFIKLTNATVGNRITKIRAEISMTRALILGFGLSFLINLWKLVDCFDGSRMVLGVFLLVAIAGSAGANRHLDSLAKNSMRNYAYLLEYEREKPKEPMDRG